MQAITWFPCHTCPKHTAQATKDIFAQLQLNRKYHGFQKALLLINNSRVTCSQAAELKVLIETEKTDMNAQASVMPEKSAEFTNCTTYWNMRILR